MARNLAGVKQMPKPKPRPVRIPDTKPDPTSPEDLARAIFRDADRKLAAKLGDKKQD